MTTKKAVEHVAIVVAGVEGPSLYIDGYCVAGPKPWGGGKTLHEFRFTDADLKEAERTRRKVARSA
jgi:hypothetical protein